MKRGIQLRQESGRGLKNGSRLRRPRKLGAYAPRYAFLILGSSESARLSPDR